MKPTARLPYRPNVCMLVLSRDGRLFLGERLGESGVWQFPQGGVEPHLSLEENVLKELEEELGAPKNLFRIARRCKATHRYDYRETPAFARGRWRGQSQSFWLLEFLGAERDINLNVDHPEFSSWRWCTPAEVRILAEPVRLPGYLKPLAEAQEYLDQRGVA